MTAERAPGDFVLVDGIVGRVVEIPITRRRRARRAERYLTVNWDRTAAAAVRLGTDHPTRLWLLVQMQTALEHSSWITPRRQLLDQIGLPERIRDIIVRLERAGLIEVLRRPNKRAMVRLAGNKER